MTELHPEMHERRILGTELLWAFGVGVLVAATLSMIVFTALTMNINPPSNAERIDPKTLHLSGEFTEPNLGTRVEPRSSITARIVATQFAFVPNCVVLPEGQPVTLRFEYAGCDTRSSGRRHEREHDGGAGLRRAGAYGILSHRRSADAVS